MQSRRASRAAKTLVFGKSAWSLSVYASSNRALRQAAPTPLAAGEELKRVLRKITYKLGVLQCAGSDLPRLVVHEVQEEVRLLKGPDLAGSISFPQDAPETTSGTAEGGACCSAGPS